MTPQLNSKNFRPKASNMKDTEWVLIDTETTGFTSPIFVVEIGAQKMRGWQPMVAPFRRLLNQNLDIPP